MLKSLGHSASFHQILFKDQCQLEFPGLADDSARQKIDNETFFLSILGLRSTISKYRDWKSVDR